jgi:hypothetical protein
MKKRVVVCDCHCVPMDSTAVICVPFGGSVVCWLSDCGRYYVRSIGYFHVRGPIIGQGHVIDGETLLARPCPNQDCAGQAYMALVSNTAEAESRIWWYCFKCRTVQEQTAHCIGVERPGAA